MELVYIADLKSVPYGMWVRPPPRPPRHNKLQPFWKENREGCFLLGKVFVVVPLPCQESSLGMGKVEEVGLKAREYVFG